MSNFRTALSIGSTPEKIKLDHAIFTIGSCFADNLGRLLLNHKFNVSVNPFGTSYNPLSIHKLLSYAIHNRMPDEDTYGVLNDTHFNFDFHSSFSTLSRNLLEKNIQKIIYQSHQAIRTCSVLMITYGTAWVYHRNENEMLVSNCHKVKSSEFTKHLLTQKKVLDSFETLHKDLLALNPDIRIILTISPVRHLKDTLELNAVSKAVLRLSCHTIASQAHHVDYFPAFELMMDDLRDYRFYDSDLIHPSAEAIDYLWGKFCDRYFDEDTRQFVEEWSNISKSLHHKPFLPESEGHQQFLRQLLKRLEELKKKVNVDKEISLLERQLIH